MRVIYTQNALADLDAILARLFAVNPLAAAAVEKRISAAIARAARWPESARAVTQWGGNIRAMPLVRYPYVIFYRIQTDTIEIVHIRHSSREPWRGEH